MPLGATGDGSSWNIAIVTPRMHQEILDKGKGMDIAIQMIEP